MYYQFFGYGQFANYVINNTGDWDGSESKINEKVKNFISKEFDDRVIIIDEIQNIKTDKREGYIKISLRSKGIVSVNDVARKYYTGGGHRNAAGGSSYVNMKDTIEQFEKLLPTIISE